MLVEFHQQFVERALIERGERCAALPVERCERQERRPVGAVADVEHAAQRGAERADRVGVVSVDEANRVGLRQAGHPLIVGRRTRPCPASMAPVATTRVRP